MMFGLGNKCFLCRKKAADPRVSSDCKLVTTSLAVLAASSRFAAISSAEFPERAHGAWAQWPCAHRDGEALGDCPVFVPPRTPASQNGGDLLSRQDWRAWTIVAATRLSPRQNRCHGQLRQVHVLKVQFQGFPKIIEDLV